MRIDLGRDQWAEILDVEDVPRRTKFRIQEWALGQHHADALHGGVITMVMRDMLIAYVVTDWSYGAKPDGEPERVRDLPSGAYDKLLEATEGHYNDLDFIRKSLSSSDSKTTSEDSPSPDTSPTPDTSAP